MTKVDIQFDLERPLDAADFDRIESTYSVYGMLGVTSAPGSTRLAAEYDASRLTPADVGKVLRCIGIPLRLNERAT